MKSEIASACLRALPTALTYRPHRASGMPLTSHKRCTKSGESDGAGLCAVDFGAAATRILPYHECKIDARRIRSGSER